LFYSTNLAITFGVFSGAYKSIFQALTNSKRIFDILDRIPSIPSTFGAKIEKFKGKIEFQNVSFAVITID
jgi:putative ABC transport system ATP-binding protein